jgi:NADP-reducing hydrogenase subunit HndB
MGKMTLEDLRKLRAEQQGKMVHRETEGKEIQVIIGMGTCGIAAGAKEALTSFLDEVEKNGIQNVLIKQTGCMGLCYVEPTAEIRVPGMPDTIYGNVDAKVAREIVQSHIIGKKLVSNHIFDRPAADILRNK